MLWLYGLLTCMHFWRNAFYNWLNKMKYHSMNGHSHLSCNTIILKDYHQHEFWAVCEYHISSRYFTCLNLDFFNRALMCPYLVRFGNHSFAEGQADSIKAVALQNVKVWLRNKIQFGLLNFLKLHNTVNLQSGNLMLISTGAHRLLSLPF